MFAVTSRPWIATSLSYRRGQARSQAALFPSTQICSEWTPLRTCLREPKREMSLKQVEEPDSSGGSSADEEAKPPGAGWTGTGKPMQVGVGYTVRDLCDGQTLASPGRWPPSMRRYPRSDERKAVAVLVKRFSECFRNGKALDGSGTWTSQGMPFSD